MTSTVASKPDEYRGHAEECWKFAKDAEDIETRAVFQFLSKPYSV